MKKIATWVLTAFLVLILAACGEQEPVATTQGDTSVTVSNEQDSKPTMQTTDPVDEDNAEEKSDSADVETPEAVAPELTAFEKLFSEGLLFVEGQNGLWGYIDINGNWVIEPQFDYSGIKSSYVFYEGRALAHSHDTELWGFIGTNGEWLIEPKFAGLYIFYDGLAVAQDPATEKWGYINSSGDWAIEPIYRTATNFHNGVAAVFLIDERGFIGNYFIDTNGQVIISLNSYKYSVATLFHDGVAFISTGGSAPYGNQPYRIIDEKGNTIADLPFGFWPLRADTVETITGDYIEWSYDRLVLGDKEYWYERQGHGNAYDPSRLAIGNSVVIDKKANIVFNGFEHNCNIIRVLNERGDLQVVDKITGGMGIININGEWVIEPVKGQSIRIYSDKISFSNDNTIDELGHKRTKSVEIQGIGGDYPPYEEIKPLTDEERAMILSVKKIEVDGVEKYGLANSNGEVVVDYIYDTVIRASDDYSCFGAQYEGLWGIIDREGNWLLQPRFLEISGISRPNN